jgi:murein DD-endopeptidase MepM/ murein hydrolase activator NlpD
VFGFCLTVLYAAPARADGLILDARPAGDAGPQLDAAVISPLPMRPVAGASGSGRAAPSAATHMIQPGDTLASIAERFGTGVRQLTLLNGITNPDRIFAGQVLKVGAPRAAGPALATGGPLERVQFWPWPPAQGQTLAVWLELREPATLRAALDGRYYPVVTSGRRGWTLIPIPPLIEPGSKVLRIEVGDATVQLPVTITAGAFPSVNIPPETSEPILSQEEKVQAETARMGALFGEVTAIGWAPRNRFSPPLVGDFPRTSPYGSRRTYGDSPAITAHAGEDFSAAAGTPVYAPAAGLVILAEPLLVRGNAVVLDHGGGVYTGYWHLSELAVEPGDLVTPGQRLGAVGSTGLSTGAHLHWEMRVGGLPVDPLQWLAEP